MPYYPERKPEEPEKKPPAEENGPKTQEPQAHRRLRAGLLCFFFIIALYGGIRLTGYWADLAASRETERELREIYGETEPPSDTPASSETAAPAAEETAVSFAVPAEGKIRETEGEETTGTTGTETQEEKDSGMLRRKAYPENPGLKVSERFVRLRRRSGYIIGWLSMDGVEEPVALKDNTFFLDHDAEGKRNRNGAIFLDEGTDLLTRPYTIFLYGHNMKSGNMFGRLKRYLDSAYYFKHRTVSFDHLYEDGRYTVFAAAQISTEPGTADYFNLWALDSRNREERGRAIRRLAAMTPYDTLTDVREDEQLLVLVTCTGDDTDRMLVAARRLREGEQADNPAFRKE